MLSKGPNRRVHVRPALAGGRCAGAEAALSLSLAFVKPFGSHGNLCVLWSTDALDALVCLFSGRTDVVCVYGWVLA